MTVELLLLKLSLIACEINYYGIRTFVSFVSDFCLVRDKTLENVGLAH